MKTDLINSFILALCFLALFGIAELLYRKYNMRAEHTRKIVHIGTGLLTLLFPLMLSNHWWVLFLCASFTFILIASLCFRFLPSINAINRFSVGSIAFPVAVYAAFLFYDRYNKDNVFFYLPILILAISDPIAALAGKKWPLGIYKTGATVKTISGVAGFFISAFIIGFFVFYLNQPAAPRTEVFLKSLAVALVSCMAEAFTGKGFDNLSIPAAVLAALVIFEKITV